MLIATLLACAVPTLAAPTLPQAQEAFELTPSPLAEDEFLAFFLRDLYVRWPVEVTPEAIGSHRGLIVGLRARAQHYGPIGALYDRALELSLELEELFERHGALDGAVPPVPASISVASLDALPRVAGDEPLRQVISLLEQRLDESEHAFPQAREELRAYTEALAIAWKKSADALATLSLRHRRPIDAAFEPRAPRLHEELISHPSDPLALAAAARVAEDDAETPWYQISYACAFSRAAALIPREEAYADLRLALHERAASLAVYASSRDWFGAENEAPFSYPTLAAEKIVTICRAWVAEHESSDGLYHLALALGFADEAQAGAEAMLRALTLDRGNAEIAYEAACLFSRSGDPQSAEVLLRHACELGSENVAWSRRDPDLENLRRQRPTEFTEITEPRWEWEVDAASGEIRLSNLSTFPLSDVSLTPTILSPDGGAWSVELTTDVLPPGRTAIWPLGAGEVPAGEATATLSADQV